MIVDCHTHLGRNEHINATVKQLLESMDKSGIDKALVFAGMLNDCSNEYLLEQIAPHKDRLLGVAAADMAGTDIVYRQGLPTMGDIQDEAKKIAEWYGEGKIVACKFYTGYHHYYPQDRLIEDYLMSLESVGCPAIFHSGDCLNSVKKAKLKYSHPLHIDEVAVDYPGMNFIIAHMAFPWQRDAAEVCYKNANVYSDISGFVYGDFSILDKVKFQKTLNEFIDIAGSEKLLFGTDWPISNQFSYKAVLENIYGNQMNAESLSKNVSKAFKL